MNISRKNVFWESNPEWYRINDKGKYELTEKAPHEAQESFAEFMRPRKEMKNPFI